MAYQRYWNYAGNYAAGDPNPAPGCTITVYNAGGGVLSTIFSDGTGTAKANPFVSDAATGFFFFYAAGGNYDVMISGLGITIPFTWADLIIPLTAGASFGSTATANTWAAGNTFDDDVVLGADLLYGATPVIVAGKIPALSSTYFASLSGANLTALNATQLASGTLPSARLSGVYSAALQFSNAANIFTGASLWLGAAPPAVGTGAINLTYNEALVSDDGAGTGVWLVRYGNAGGVDRLEINDATTLDLIPAVTDVSDLGSATKRYLNTYIKNLYVEVLRTGSTLVAQTGALRLQNGAAAGIYFRDSVDGVDLGIYLDATNRIVITAPTDIQGDLSISASKFTGQAHDGVTYKSIAAMGYAMAHGDWVILGDAALLVALGYPHVACGGGAAPTLGTIGGTGPAGAAQHGWYQILDDGGSPVFIPIWA
jgi:hypothetical protein